MALITQEEFLTFYQKDRADERDAMLAKMVCKHVSEWIQTYLGRKLERASHTQHIRPDKPRRLIYLANPPVESVASVSAGSNALPETDWSLDNADLGEIWLARPMVPGQRYTVEYTGGFQKIPEDIKGVVLRQTAIAFKRTREKSWEVSAVDSDTAIGSGISERLTANLSVIERTVLSRYRVI